MANLEGLQIEATGLQVRREAAQPVLPAGGSLDSSDTEAIADVRDALAAIQSVMIDGEVDRNAEALAAAWIDLNADLEELGGPQDGASYDELERARARFEVASAALAAIDAEASVSVLTRSSEPSSTLPTAPSWRPRSNTGGRFGGGAARRRLEEAQAAERALLDQHGFGGYLDVVLTGGRAGATNPARAAAEQEHFQAKTALAGRPARGRHERGSGASRRRARPSPRADHGPPRRRPRG